MTFSFASKGVHYRAYYRWLKGDCFDLFPKLPSLSRLLRVLQKYEVLTDEFLAQLQAESMIYSYGIERVHPVRKGRSEGQLGKKGKSNRRWIVGIKLCWLVTSGGQIVDWGWKTANEHDQKFRDIGLKWSERTKIRNDFGFNKRGEEAPNWQFCGHGERNDQMIVERVFSLITVVRHFNKIFHRVEKYLTARIGYMSAMFNTLLAMAEGKLAIARFSL